MTQATRRLAFRGPPGRPRADVMLVDPQAQRVAVVTDWGYTVADIMSGELRPRDVIEGLLETLGRSTWTNLSTGLPVTVTVTHVQATMIGAQRLMQR